MSNLFLFLPWLFPSQDPRRFSTVKAIDNLLYASYKDTLPYRLLKPAQQGLKNKFPLVIFLHVAGERGTDNEVPDYSTSI